MQPTDVENILTSLGIKRRRIVPTNVSQKNFRTESKFSQFESDISYFPLEWFDRGIDDESARYFSQCREGIGFLPSSSSSSSSKPMHPVDYEWRKVSIRQYNNKSNKWHIEDVSSGGGEYEVPRIYLMFAVEDPLKFSKRVQRAVEERDSCEFYLKFEALLNAFPMHSIPKPSLSQRDRVKRQLRGREKEEKQEEEEECNTNRMDLIEFYQREYTIVYQKVFAAQQLIKHPPLDTARYIELHRRLRGGKLKNLATVCVHADAGRRYKTSQRSIRRLWLYCCPQSIKIMEFINNECEHVSRMSLFHLQTSKEEKELVCWEQFRHLNNLKLQSVSDFLQTQWIEKIVGEIRYRLAGVHAGTEFDLDVKCWHLYRHSKLYRLLQLVKQRMHVSVVKLLKSSLRAYVNHLSLPCESFLHIPDDFQWNPNDLLRSPFHSSAPPLFRIHLNIDGDEVNYSLHSLASERVENEIVDMMQQSVLTTHQIPQIDPYLIKHLKFDVKSMRLASIGFLDAELQNQIFHLRHCYSKCLTLLLAYAREYRKFIQLKSLDVRQCTKSESLSLAEEISTKIRTQMRLCDDVRTSIPESIIIGPFFVDINSLRQSLIDKRTELAECLRQRLLRMAGERVAAIQQRYDAIMERLRQPSRTIEHLDGIAKWIPSVARSIDQLSGEMMTVVTDDFKCIESFRLRLPDELFGALWRALRMPQIVSRQANETRKQHEVDVERFRRMHASDEIVFAERVDAIARDIDAFVVRRLAMDESSVEVLTKEGKVLWDELEEVASRRKLLNRRCEIFNQPEIDMDERLNVLSQRLFPHHKLLTMTSNFLSSKEVWTSQMPLSALDVQSIEAEMERYETLVGEFREHFSNADVVVERISSEMREMMKFIDIAKMLINPDMSERHWMRLCEELGAEFTFTSESTTLNELQKFYILSRSDFIRELSIEATAEATRERERLIRIEEEEMKRKQQEELEHQRRVLRRLARPDIFN